MKFNINFVLDQFDVDSEDGGLVVNDKMQTSVPHVYAAGDVCHVGWEVSPFWLQVSHYFIF
jgi:thioredoxin reductase